MLCIWYKCTHFLEEPVASFFLILEAKCYSETAVYFCETVRRHILVCLVATLPVCFETTCYKNLETTKGQLPQHEDDILYFLNICLQRLIFTST